MVIQYPRPPMNLVWPGISLDDPIIFVGGMQAAADISGSTESAPF